MPDAATPQPRRDIPWKGLRVLAIVLLLPIAFLVVAAVMLVDTDIDAPDWVESRVEARASAMMQGGEVAFSDVFVKVGRDLHPRVRLVDVKVTDAAGTQIARIPAVEAQMSPRGLLFQAEVLFQDVALTGPLINLNRAADGSVVMAFGAGNGFDETASLVGVLDHVDQYLDAPALAALETISANGVIINYNDARAGRSWTVDGGVLDLDLRGGQTSLTGDFALLAGGADITRLQLGYDSPRGERSAKIGLSLTNARARDIATQTPALAWLADVDAALTASLRTSLDNDGALGPLSATLDLGAGALQPNAATEPVVFDRAKAYLTYDPASDQIQFDQIEIATQAGDLRATGQAILGEAVDGIPQSLVAQFDLPDARLAQSDFYPEGLQIPPVAIDMRLRLSPFGIDLGQVVLVDGDTHLTAAGQVSATQDGWQAAIDIKADHIATERLVALCPIGVKPGSRNWLAQNVSTGDIQDAALALRLRQGTPAAMTGRFDFVDAGITFMRSMPPISGGYGVGHIQDNKMFLSLDRGNVTPQNGGGLDVAGTTMTVLDTRVPGSDAVLNLAMTGTITGALSLLDREPFRFVSEAGQSVTMADGRADVRGQIQFPLRKGVTPDQITFGIAADLRNLYSDTIIKGRELRAARMGLTADNDGLRITGPVSLDGIAAHAAWTKQFGPEHVGQSKLQATFALTQRTLDAFNIEPPRGTVAGAGQGDLDVDMVAGRAPKFRLSSNLRGVALSMPSIGWRKPENARGDLLVAGTLGAVPQITALNISGGGLQARGAVTLKDNGTLDRATFSSVKIGDWLSAPVILRGRGKGRPVGVTLGAGRVDLRGAAFGAGQADAGPMALRLDRLQVTQGIALHDFRGDFTGTGGFAGEFSGRVNGGPRVQGTVAPQNGRSALRLRSDDAGGVIGAAGFLENGIGGRLDLILRPTGGAGTFDGDLNVTGLRVRDAPAMAALLDSISVIGLLRQLDGQGLAFDEVEAKFRLTPTQVIVTQSSAIGPGLGISLDGIYTLASKQVDFQGVISPFYILNGIASFLTRKGEGLIGFNFNLTGDAAAPSVAVNPLSALTPGMFREIFRRPAPQVSQ